MPAPPVLLDIDERIATITLNRPEARNALSNECLVLLGRCVDEAERNRDVDVIILTGADPAFCAGLDLGEMSEGASGAVASASTTSSAADLQGGSSANPSGARHKTRGPIPKHAKPVIGAINGAAITGGLEIALNCDFLIASERAEFGDTHARVGIMPGWGLTVLLPQAIGVRRAREMSYTGNFMSADEALSCGLVNHVVAHDELIPFTRALGADIVGNDQAAVRQIRGTYDAIAHDDDAWETEARGARVWQRTTSDPGRVAHRRAATEARGRAQ